MKITESLSEPGHGRQPPLWGWWCMFGAFVLWALLNLHWGRGITWDEVEYLQATDLVRQGLVPYRDFFEHHTPLTWFLMAPFEALSHQPGVGPVLWLRWVQVPMWGLALWRLNVWMQEEEAPKWARLCALACLIGSPFFVFSALEYRVDTLGTVFAILGLDWLRRPGVHSPCMVGAFLSLSVLANLRFAPFAVMVALLMAFMNLEARCWRFQPSRLSRLVLGAALALLPWALYLWATHSFEPMWQRCIVQNQVAQSIIGANRTMGLHLWRPVTNADIPALMLEFGMLAGSWSLLKTFRHPKFMHMILLVQVANFAFIGLMKVHFPYHFELTLCLAVPFLAMALARAASALLHRGHIQWAFLGALGIGLVINVSNLQKKNDHKTLKYQDLVVKEAARLAPPGSRVLDACGWMLGRSPAYKYWFYPMYVRLLSTHQLIEPYTAEDFRQDPPALVIASLRLNNWSSEWPEVGKLVITHYLPTLPNLWVPAMSYPFRPIRREWTWTVPASGEYRILCSAGLIKHPWFHAPFMIVDQNILLTDQFTIRRNQYQNSGQDQLHWALNGQTIEPVHDQMRLTRGSQLSATFVGNGSLGVMLIPDGIGPLFLPSSPSANLDYISFLDYYRATK